MDLATIKNTFGAQASLFGGIDTQQVLPFGSLDDVEEEVQRVMSAAGQGGGYIISGAHNIQPDTSVEKIVKLFEWSKSMESTLFKNLNKQHGNGEEVTAMHLNYGMVGGGRGALIGKAHRTSIALNGDCRLAAGAFSSSTEKNLASGRDLGVDDDRIYASFAEMAQKEAAREDGIDFVVIVTPNHLHFSAAKAFLKQGIHVVCDKPLTISSAEGIELKRLAKAWRAFPFTILNVGDYIADRRSNGNKSRTILS